VTSTEAKRKRGKPKAELAIIPIHDFPGPSNRDKLQQLYDQWFNCQRCDLSTFRSTEDVVFGEGNPNADVLIIGEAPGEEEDRQKVPFIGPSGNLLNKILASVSDNEEIRTLAEWIAKAPQNAANLRTFHERVTEWRHTEFFITNVVACRPPENGTPSNPSLKACWERVWNIIQIIDPVLIFAVGKVPASTLMKKQVEITKTRGTLFDVTYPSRVGNITYPVMPVLHPSYLLRKADWKTRGGDYEKTIEDWRRGLRMVDFLRQQHRGTSLPKR
jgi:uracil-DNA glycosylase family 4